MDHKKRNALEQIKELKKEYGEKPSDTIKKMIDAWESFVELQKRVPRETETQKEGA